MTLPEPVFPLAQGLHNVVATALSSLLSLLADTVGGPVGRALIAPGQVVPADGCCPPSGSEVAPGQAWARFVRMFPSTRFPQADQAWTPVPKNMVVEIELGVYRCVAGLDGSGSAPPADEVSGDAIRALDDVAALQAAALQTFGRTPVVLGSSASLGPSGYCAGSTLTFMMAFNPACPPIPVVEEGG